MQPKRIIGREKLNYIWKIRSNIECTIVLEIIKIVFILRKCHEVVFENSLRNFHEQSKKQKNRVWNINNTKYTYLSFFKQKMLNLCLKTYHQLKFEIESFILVG